MFSGRSIYFLFLVCSGILLYELYRQVIFHKTWRTRSLVLWINKRDTDASITTCRANQSSGPIKVFTDNDTMTAMAEKYLRKVTPGGRWRPPDCLASSRVAIIVPYRNRTQELAVFLHHMHPFLQRQNLEYTIFLVEQADNHPFNRGAISNVGFLEAVTRGSYDCFIIHDVDVLPEDDRISYECTDNPRHLSAACSRWKYRLAYPTIFGGVSAFSRYQFQKVNGFSNAYFGWGAEDDDLSARVRKQGYKIVRYPLSVAHYKTLEHKRAKVNTVRRHYLSGRELRYFKDGLNSIKYSLFSFEEKPLFTHVQAGLDKTAIMKHVDDLMAAFKAKSAGAKKRGSSLKKTKPDSENIRSNKTSV